MSKRSAPDDKHTLPDESMWNLLMSSALHFVNIIINGIQPPMRDIALTISTSYFQRQEMWYILVIENV